MNKSIPIILMFIVSIIACTISVFAIDASITNYWSLDEPSGNPINSISGGNNCTIAGSESVVTGIISNARNQTSAINTNYIDCGNTGNMENFTLSFWLYPESLSCADGCPIAGFRSTDTLECILHTSQPNKIICQVSTDKYYYILSDASLTTQAWNYIALTRNSTGLNICVNGVCGGSSWADNGIPSGTIDLASSFRFGAVTGNTADPSISTRMDELMITNRAWSPTEINSTYQNYLIGHSPLYVEPVPSITFISPTPVNGTIQYYPVTNLTIVSATENMSGSLNTTIRIYSSNGVLYSSSSNLSANFSYTISIPSNGTYFFNVSTSNGTYTANSSTRSFSMLTNLSLNFTSPPTPSNGSVYFNSVSLKVESIARNFNTSALSINTNVFRGGSLCFQGGSNIGDGINYSITGSCSTAGNYTIVSIATDGLQNLSTTFNTRYFQIYNLVAGSISSPSNNSNVTRYLSINWSNASSTVVSVPITGFNVYLFTNGMVFNRTLSNVTGLNLSNYDTYTNYIPVGYFYVVVEYFDSYNNSVNSTPIRFYHASDGLLNITAKEYNTTDLSVFSLNVNGVLYNTSTGLVQFDTVRNSIYNVYINPAGMMFDNKSVTANATFQAYQFTSLYPNASLFVSIFDESSLSQIVENITVTLTDTTNPEIRYDSTVNGNVTFFNLKGGDVYEIRFSSVNWTGNRYYRITVSTLYDRLNAYLLKNNLNQSVSMCFYNTNGVYIPLLHVYQSVLSPSGYLITQDQFTDINGKTSFIFNPATYYRYTWNSSVYALTFFNLNPPLNSQVLSDGCNYDITLVSAASIASYETVKVTGNYSFNNVSRILTLSYTSLNSSYNTYYFNVFKTVNGVNVLLCNNSNTAISGFIDCNMSGYYGQVYVRGTADASLFYGSWTSLGNTSSFSDVVGILDAALICGLIMLVVAMGGLAFGSIGAGISGVVGLLAIFWLGMFTPVTAVVVIIDTVITIVILASLKPRGT